MAMLWIHQGGIFFLFLMVGTVSGIDPSTSSISVQISTLGSQLSTLGAQLIHLKEEVEGLQQENMEDKERIVHLEQVTEGFERRLSLMESLCGSAEIETEISEIETGIHGPLVAIGGENAGVMETFLSSAEVVNTSCDFPLPEAREGHVSVTTADGKTLVCGGRTSSNYTASCLQFNSQSKNWEHHSTMRGKNRYLSSVVELRHGVYIFGGEFGDVSRSSEFLATGSSMWTWGPSIPGDGVRDSCVAKLSDTEFVILGGSSDGGQARVFNYETGEWREWPRLAVSGIWTYGHRDEAYGHTCMGLGDIVLMAGGSDHNWDITGRTVIFDTKTGSAREVASLNHARGWAAMVLYGGKPLILGGHDSKTSRSDGEIWNMDTETWEEADIHLNISRYRFSLVATDEKIMCE